jgi:hypothetical protein
MAYQPKSYRKFLAGTITAAVVASAVAPAASAAEVKFTDLTGVSAETLTAIEALVGLNVIVGFPDGTFKPNQPINNSQAAEMIVKFLPNVDPKAAPTGKVFEDLTEKSYASKFAEALVDAGLIPAGGKFNATAGITREAMAVVAVKAFGLKDTGAAVEIKDLDKASEAARASIKILAQHNLTNLLEGNFRPTETVTRSQFALFFYRGVQAVEAAAKSVQLTEAKAAGVKKISVSFNKEVDFTKATVTVKRGSSNVAIAKLTPAADKKSAIVELNSNLAAGKYTVNVSGLTEAALTKEIEVEAEKVDSVVLLSDNVIITGEKTATVGYEVRNQYAEKMNTLNPVATSTRGTAVATAGTVTLTNTVNFEAGQKLTLTLVDTSSAKSVSKELTVVAAATTSNVAFVGLVDSTAKAVTELNQKDHATNAFLKVDAKDQYGRAVTDVAKLNDDLLVTVSTGGPVTLVDKVTDDATKPNTVGAQPFTTVSDSSNNKHTVIELDVADASGTAVVTVISKSTGVATSYTVNVTQRVKADVITLGTPDASIIAGGDKVLFPVTATSNKGEAVTTVAGLGTSTVSPSGVANSTAKWIEKDGKLFAEVTIGSVAAAGGVLVLTTTSETSKVDTKITSVRETATAKNVIGLKSDVANYIFAGQSLALASKNFVVQDQYGREMDTAAAGFTTVITATDVATSTTVTLEGLTVKAGTTKGTEAVTFALQGVTGSATDVTFRVVDRSEFVNYEVADISTIYANEATFTAPATDKYNKTLAVYGITADGKKVKLPATEYSVHETSAYLSYASGVLNATKDIDDTKTFEGSADVIVTINATGTEFKKTVTISEAAPKVETVVVKNAAGTAVTALDYTLEATGFEKTDITGIVVTDTYGVENSALATVDRITFSNLKEKEGNTTPVVFELNGTGSAVAKGLSVGDTFDATVTVGGKTVKLAVTVK